MSNTPASILLLQSDKDKQGERTRRGLLYCSYVPTYSVCNVPRCKVDRNKEMCLSPSHWCHRRCCHGNALQDIKQWGRNWRWHCCHSLSQKGVPSCWCAISLPNIKWGGPRDWVSDNRHSVFRDRSLTSLWVLIQRRRQKLPYGWAWVNVTGPTFSSKNTQTSVV